jgi:hypothetical protein
MVGTKHVELDLLQIEQLDQTCQRIAHDLFPDDYGPAARRSCSA